jgi:hypothetical protein
MQSSLLCIGEVGSSPHAKGIVDDEEQQSIGRSDSRSLNVWIGKGQYDQTNKSGAQGKQDQVPQTPMSGRALYSTLKEHERTDWTRRCCMAPQEMDVDRDT